MTVKRTAWAWCVMAAVIVGGVHVAAQGAAAKAKTGTEFYLAYLAAFEKATSIDEIAPWLAKEQRDRIAATPKDERTMMFGMIKEMSGDHTNIKVIKETPTSAGADLDVEAVSKSTKGKTKAKVTLLKEGGDWKVGKESWSS